MKVRSHKKAKRFMRAERERLKAIADGIRPKPLSQATPGDVAFSMGTDATRVASTLLARPPFRDEPLDKKQLQSVAVQEAKWVAVRIKQLTDGGMSEVEANAQALKELNVKRGSPSPTVNLTQHLLDQHGNLYKPKRSPLLCDKFLVSDLFGIGREWERDKIVPPKYRAIVRDGIIQAKRFVMDEEATTYVGEYIRKVPESIAYAQEFAIPPFPLTYIELPIWKLWEEVNEIPSASFPDHDRRIGYLYHGPNVYIIMEGHDGTVGMLPYFYRMNRPFKIDEELAICEITGFNRDQLDSFFWGTSYATMAPAYARSLRENHSFEMCAPPPKIDAYHHLFMNSGGDMRNIIAVLLFLNQTSKVRTERDVPMARGMIGPKPSAYLKHSIITLRLNPVPMLKKQLGGGPGGGGGLWRREHDVRGHFCRDKDAREAEAAGKCGTVDTPLHDWREYGPNQWRCMACTGLRWWKRAYHRGHKEKGTVSSEYAVTQ